MGQTILTFVVSFYRALHVLTLSLSPRLQAKPYFFLLAETEIFFLSTISSKQDSPELPSLRPFVRSQLVVVLFGLADQVSLPSTGIYTKSRNIHSVRNRMQVALCLDMIWLS
ncbi:hypothetical protein FRX31_024772 [Thalictrum thalictroides]|uniref:Secreted protein n=1 Tax=Thalictrum thalictroides TaxID=46969 RepID=A0A7J6VN98_THATH|nr:hypothetical protein FRX31_024772 [Thalictrum thalictroides]